MYQALESHSPSRCQRLLEQTQQLGRMKESPSLTKPTQQLIAVQNKPLISVLASTISTSWLETPWNGAAPSQLSSSAVQVSTTWTSSVSLWKVFTPRQLALLVQGSYYRLGRSQFYLPQRLHKWKQLV